MKKLLTLIFSLMFISLSAQVEYLYDFNSLQTGTKCLNGQDSWVTHYQTASTSPDFDVDYVCGDLTTPDETIGIFYPYGGPGIGRTATRKATPNFNFNFQDGGIMDLEMDMEMDLDLEMELDMDMDLDLDLEMELGMDLDMEKDVDMDLELGMDMDMEIIPIT